MDTKTKATIDKTDKGTNQSNLLQHNDLLLVFSGKSNTNVGMPLIIFHFPGIILDRVNCQIKINKVRQCNLVVECTSCSYTNRENIYK